MKKLRFDATLEEEEKGSVTYVRVPFDVKAELGRARPPVKVTINGHSYRSTVAVYGGEYFVAVRRANREAAGIAANDRVSVSLELDTTPRVVEAPRELKAALRADPVAQRAWKALSYTHQREHAEAIRDAKKPETRERRVAKAIEMLRKKPAKKR